MNAVRSKRQLSILRTIEKIEAGTFDEDDIKSLLIDLRENTPADSITRELGDFIAHDIQSKGIFHKAFDFRALALKGQWPPLSGVLNINGLNFFALPKPAYEALYNTAIDFAAKADLLRYSGLIKKDARKYMRSIYVFDKKKQKYNLISTVNIYKISILIRTLTRVLDANPIVSAYEIIHEINKDIKNIFTQHLEGKRYTDSILRFGDDVVVCILSLFQDVKFTLYDGSEAHFVLTEAFEPPVREPARQRTQISPHYYLHKYGMIMAGMITAKGPEGTMTYQTTFIETDLRLPDYADLPPFEGKYSPVTIHDVQALRDAQGRLKLTPYPD